MNIEIVKGDITEINVDAIVNAANSSLLGGGGVDGAIHEKAGSMLLEECKKLNGCNVGEAKITGAYNLPSKYVIHTVAPQWYLEYTTPKEELLKNCYVNSLKLAEEYNIKSIAFPCIGMGVYKCPLDIGTAIAIDTVKEYAKHTNIEKVVFVCYTQDLYDMYIKYFNKNN